MGIHVNNIGTSFRATAQDQDGNIVPVTTGDELLILFQKPDGSALVRSAAVVSGLGPSGQFEYISVSGDLDQAGSWKLQGFVSQSGGQWYTDEVKFKVLPNIEQVN